MLVRLLLLGATEPDAAVAAALAPLAPADAAAAGLLRRPPDGGGLARPRSTCAPYGEPTGRGLVGALRPRTLRAASSATTSPASARRR